MKSKKIVSLVALVLGLFLVIYSLYNMGRISDAKNEVSTISKGISGSKVGKALSGEMAKKAGSYDTEVRWMLISGIVLVIAGGAGVYYCRKHHHHR